MEGLRMTAFSHQLFSGFIFLIFSSFTSVAFAETLFEGKWRSIDDRLGYSQALIEIKQAADGKLEGYILKLLPRPDGVKPPEYCSKCTGEFKDKPITGLRFMWDVKIDPNNPKRAVDGRALDPFTGRFYRGSARLIAGDNRMVLRGYVGISLLGRSQTWIRESEASAEKLMQGKNALPAR